MNKLRLIFLLLILVCILLIETEAKSKKTGKSCQATKGNKVKRWNSLSDWMMSTRNGQRGAGQCKKKCKTDQYCVKKWAYKCIVKSAAEQQPPPEGDPCRAGVYENYCCETDGYGDDGYQKYFVISIGSKCTTTTDGTGICKIYENKKANLKFAYCFD